MNDLDALALEPGNHAAVEAARGAADGRNPPHAPLVVQGEHGCGTTELLQAVVERFHAQRPGGRLEMLSPDTLAQGYRAAGLAGGGEAYRARLAETELLLLDGLESLARHRECQELLADLLDVRRAAGRETVVTVTPDVTVLEGLDPRVSRRVRQGTEVRLTRPGPAARRSLLHRRQSGPDALAEPVIQALAEAEFPSLRDYFGALARLLAFQEASAVPLAPEDALLLVGVTGAPLAPAPAPVPPEDEFTAFLSEVTDEVATRLDHWRQRIREAVRYWQAEGLRTRRLEALLDQEVLTDPGPMLREYEAAAGEIMGLAAEAAAISPDLAGAEAFRDPDQLAAARLLVDAARLRAPLSAPLPQYRWEDFAEGPTNRLSVRAGNDILGEPGRHYSPLVVTGGPGSGKSHFLHGLGNALIERGLGPVVCLAGPAFAAEVRGLADATAAAEWRRRYHWVGAFLLDDLHLLGGELRVQQELASLFSELLDGRRQIVVASLRPLEQLSQFDAGLLSLLGGGLAVELPPPDREVRLALIRKQIAGSDPAPGVPADAALLDYLAGRPAESVRAVQGMVQRVLSAAAARQVAPSPQLAREVLELGGDARPPRTPRTPARQSGVLPAGRGLIHNAEKMVTRWPRIADRLLTELR